MKKILALVACLSLVASLAVGGSIAYLKDQDSAVNVMTLGNVKIDLLEYERVVGDDGKWVSTGETDKYDYTPDEVQEYSEPKPLMPAVFADGAIKWDDRNGSSAEDGTGHQQSWGKIGAPGSSQLFDDSVKNAQDKFVFVKNTGKSDAYLRVLFAFEQGDVAADEFENVIMTNRDADHWAWSDYLYNIEIDGNKYAVRTATYLGPTSNPTGILAPEATSYASLLQVYMRPEAENEDVEALDGNDDGNFNILVTAQAVQAAGFENAETALNTAFGEVTKENIAAKAWFKGMYPETTVGADGLQNAINDANYGQVITTTENVNSTDPISVPEDANLTLNLGNNELTLPASGNNDLVNDASFVNKGEAVLTSGTLNASTGHIANTGSLTISNIDMNIGVSSGYSNMTTGSDAHTVYNNANIVGGGLHITYGAKVEFNSGSIDIQSAQKGQRYCFYAAANSEVTVNGGTFSFEQYKKRAYACADIDAVVYIKGGTFGPASNHPTDPTPPFVTANGGKVIVTGGTFGFDPTEWVADGYQAVQNGSTWTVSKL